MCRSNALVVISRDADVTCAAPTPSWRGNDDGEERLAHVAFAARFSQPVAQPVRPRDRFLDIVAAVCIVAGVALFLFARRTLTHIATGGLTLPSGGGLTHVAYTDSVVLRMRIGLWLVVVGVILAVASAISHRFRRSA